ncbi:MAG: hypothetical protein Q4E84_08365 [Clostridia bacterium]|nr:hypothetical protein [Clostridia bacterium]
MNQNKTIAILYYVCSISFLITAAVNFAGELKSNAGFIWLAVGVVWLVLGLQYKNKAKEEEAKSKKSKKGKNGKNAKDVKNAKNAKTSKPKKLK